jgi:hypothetical protein
MTTLVITVTARSTSRALTGYRLWTDKNAADLRGRQQFEPNAEPRDIDGAEKLARNLFGVNRLRFNGSEDGWIQCGHGGADAFHIDGYARVEYALVEDYAPGADAVPL